MAEEEKTNPKRAVKQVPASSSPEEKPTETTTEGGASEDTSVSPSPGLVTLSQEQMERLRRKLKARYH
jgi:hypothetical protein